MVGDFRRAVHLGKFDAGRAFSEFSGSTDQKIIHGHIIKALLESLRENGAVLIQGRPVEFLDFACGNGDTALEMVAAINGVHDAGVNYNGFDIDSRFVERTTEKLTVARQVRNQKIEGINVREADILSDDPFPFQNIPNVLVTVGHALYYVAGAEERPEILEGKFVSIMDKVKAVMGENGLCILTHNSQDCEMAQLRQSVSQGIVPMPNRLIAGAGEELGLRMDGFESTAHLTFPKLSEQQWKDLRDPSKYDRFHNSVHPNFVTMLELMSFIAQRGLGELHREGKLDGFIDQIEEKARTEGHIKNTSGYQFVFSGRRSQHVDLNEAISNAVESIKEKLPEIEAQGARDFEKKRDFGMFR